MLQPASWLPRAQELALGERLRTDHDCGPGRTLTLRHDEQGLHAFCFRCNDNGWSPPTPVPLAVRLERLRKQSEADASVQGKTELPEPKVYSWGDWPAACRLWLLKAGLSSHDAGRLGAYYHPPSDRVVLPVLARSGGVLFWQARAVDKRQPKYLAPDIGKGMIVPMYGSASTVTLTEDLLSAYKVGLVAEGWCLMGTSISKECLRLLLSRGCKVNVWLDPDAAGRKAAKKVLAALRAVGIEATDIVSAKDPKLHHREEIKELLC
jgi:hypothetical protein